MLLGTSIIGANLAFMILAWRNREDEMFSAIRWRTVDGELDAVRLGMAISLLVAVVLINGFVCGALSGPFPRYQARITWLITAGAAVSLINLAPALAAVRYRIGMDRVFATPLGVTVSGWAQSASSGFDRLRDRLSSLPVVGPVVGRIDPAFLSFGMVGAAGFVVDYCVLHSLVSFAGVDPIPARFVSFPIAVLATWLLNRNFTFRGPTAHSPVRQALIYAAVQCTGGAANLAVYSAAVALVPMFHDALILPLALGSAAGLCLTFAGSKRFAFKPAQGVIEMAGPVSPPDAAEVAETGT